MNRADTIEMLQIVAGRLAEKYGYAEAEVGEDREKGFWGEHLTEYLEKQYGECTKEIKWRDPENSSNYVEFSFRFADPVICIRTFEKGAARESLASMEFSDSVADWTHYDELRPPKYQFERDKYPDRKSHYVDWVHTGDFVCTETMLWGDKGQDYLRDMQEMLDEYKRELSKVYSGMCLKINHIAWNKEDAPEEKTVGLPKEIFIALDKEKAARIIDGNTINGMSMDSMELVLNELRAKYGVDPRRCDISVEIEVPFSDAIMMRKEDFTDTIVEESLYNLFDDFPESMTVEAPLDLLRKFYENEVLCEDDWKNGEDIRMSKWLKEEYTLDDTQGMLLWMENQCKSFKAEQWIPGFKAHCEKVKEAVMEATRDECKTSDDLDEHTL